VPPAIRIILWLLQYVQKRFKPKRKGKRENKGNRIILRLEGLSFRFWTGANQWRGTTLYFEAVNGNAIVVHLEPPASPPVVFLPALVPLTPLFLLRLDAC
jgi:hypothetical protein